MDFIVNIANEKTKNEKKNSMKSKGLYDAVWKDFLEFKDAFNLKIDELAVVTFLKISYLKFNVVEEKCKDFSPDLRKFFGRWGKGSVRSRFSILKSSYIDSQNKDFDSRIYKDTSDWITTLEKSHVKKQSKIFTNEQNDKIYLEYGEGDSLGNKFVQKVLYFVAFECLLRPIETFGLLRKDVVFKECSLNSQVCCNERVLITIKKVKTDKQSETLNLTIEPNEERCIVCLLKRYYEIHGKSEKAKDPKAPLWIQIRNGKTHYQKMGENAFGSKLGNDLAKFLELKNYKDYTGYVARRGGATDAINNGLTMAEVMLLGNWKSEKTMRGYFDKNENSMKNIQKKRKNLSTKQNSTSKKSKNPESGSNVVIYNVSGDLVVNGNIFNK